MDLHNLRPAKGSTKNRKRIGRGVGSGYGGHSSTKGDKGQKSRAGASIPTWFEGGQMPLQRRLPKYGFKNPFRIEYHAINVSKLQSLVASGRIDPKEPVTPETLAGAGLVSRKELVKVLGSGEITSALNVSAHAFSATAREKVEAAGGTVTLL